ncbi:oligosaccharide flippase family protein [Nitritalea halalkaliphila]|uniref:oligosaccharide flippase family protein n=1 Tax=Nitritalea halalkaliphila TaxID=590849 RepID=UPI001EE6658B|nr:oligosaccharide flippase family protein [Nitritalea halalkaliphila]
MAQKGLFHLLSANGLIFIAGFASQLFVAGFLDPIEIGQIKIMQTYIGFAGILGGLGFNVALIQIASKDGVSEIERNQYFNISLFIGFISFIVLYGILFIINTLGLISNDIEIKRLFPLYAIFILPLILQSSYLSFFQAIKQIKKMAFAQSSTKILSVLAIVLATWRFGLLGYIWAVVISSFIGILIFEMQIKASIFRRVKNYFIKEQVRTMWSLSGYALAANIIGTILTTLDIYMINYFVSNRSVVGFYMFALTLVSIFQLFPTSIQQIAMPYFSNKSNNFSEWLRIYKKYNIINHFAIPIFVFIGASTIVFSIPFLFKGKYDESIPFFILISVGWGIRNMNIMKGIALMGRGKFNLNFRSSFISLLISLPIVFSMIFYYGIRGAIFSHIVIGIVSYIVTLAIFTSYIKNTKNSP